jgi:uncharacterized protein (TIGR03083 family)
MSDDRIWALIDDQRRRLADLLDDLTEAQWRAPSLCEGWTVREVAAHVALQNTTLRAMPDALVKMVRHGGVNGAIRALARDHAVLPTDRLAAEIRARVGVWKPLPTVTVRETAIDYAVHGQDIAIPLGRSLAVPAELSTFAAERVWGRQRMFRARRRYAGYRFVATDSDFAVGQGDEVTGPVLALLLVLTGRPAGLAQLSGPGTDRLRRAAAPATAG